MIVFYYFFCWNTVFDPKSVRDQMVFESFTMLKMFLSAVATGKYTIPTFTYYFLGTMVISYTDTTVIFSDFSVFSTFWYILRILPNYAKTHGKSKRLRNFFPAKETIQRILISAFHHVGFNKAIIFYS